MSPRIPLPRLSSGRLALVVALLALVVASAGAGWAAATLPRNSVTTKQVKNGSLLLKDVKKGQVLGAKQKARSARIADRARRAALADRATVADSAADSATVAGLAPDDLTRTGFTAFEDALDGSPLTLKALVAPTDGFLVVTASLSCASRGTVDTQIIVDVLLDGASSNGGLSFQVLSLPRGTLGTIAYDSATALAQFPVAAGTHQPELANTLLGGTTAGCNISTSSSFSPYDENGDGPVLAPRPAAQSGRATLPR